MAGTEIERKWLVEHAPAAALAAPSEPIRQGYLTIADDGGETRIRRLGERFKLTVKSGGGLVRAEHEVELTEAQFNALWPATEGARLEKRRHRIEGPGEVVIELDVYEGALQGLLVAEVEFADADAAGAFVAPDWFGREVTEDRAYKNQRLALGPPLPAPTSA